MSEPEEQVERKEGRQERHNMLVLADRQADLLSEVLKTQQPGRSFPVRDCLEKRFPLQHCDSLQRALSRRGFHRQV